MERARSRPGGQVAGGDEPRLVGRSGPVGENTETKGLACKGCEEKQSNKIANHPVAKPPAAASHESVAHSD